MEEIPPSVTIVCSLEIARIFQIGPIDDRIKKDYKLCAEGLEIGATIEVWIFNSLKRTGGEGVFGFENQYVVTDKGYERIEGLDKRIIQVSHPICWEISCKK